MQSMLKWLATMIDRLETAGISSADVTIAISETQERQLKDELAVIGYFRPLSVHNAEYHGWRLTVKGAR